MGLYISGNSIGGMSGRLISVSSRTFSTGELLWRQSVVSRGLGVDVLENPP